jgi:hypothetical protein
MSFSASCGTIPRDYRVCWHCGRYRRGVGHGHWSNYRSGPFSPEKPGRRLECLSRLSPDLGRAILLGLEFLVAGDIIRTVVVHPTLDNLIVLAIIVVIRTLLSVTLQLEFEGHWPWQHPGVSNTKSRANKGGGGGSRGALTGGAGVELAALAGS